MECDTGVTHVLEPKLLVFMIDGYGQAHENLFLEQ